MHKFDPAHPTEAAYFRQNVGSHFGEDTLAQGHPVGRTRYLFEKPQITLRTVVDLRYAARDGHEGIAGVQRQAYAGFLGRGPDWSREIEQPVLHVLLGDQSDMAAHRWVRTDRPAPLKAKVEVYEWGWFRHDRLPGQERPEASQATRRVSYGHDPAVDA